MPDLNNGFHCCFCRYAAVVLLLQVVSFNLSHVFDLMIQSNFQGPGFVDVTRVYYVQSGGEGDSGEWHDGDLCIFLEFPVDHLFDLE